MKLKLIQAGGFAGKTKIAEKDLEQHETILQQQLTELFRQPLKAAPKSQVRDKEQLFLEFDGKRLPVQQLGSNPQLSKLIAQMINQLTYQK
ncbi:MAG: hypothetical protein ACRYFA_12975 [Janthinobacterium lividum]